MKSIEVEINGRMTPVCFAEDVDKVNNEIRERHERQMNELESHWKGVLESKEQEFAMELRKREAQTQSVMEHISSQPPMTFHDDISNVLRTCEREGNAAPAYDFLRGMGAGWWLCDKLNSSHESIDVGMTDQIRKSLNRREEK